MSPRGSDHAMNCSSAAPERHHARAPTADQIWANLRAGRCLAGQGAGGTDSRSGLADHRYPSPPLAAAGSPLSAARVARRLDSGHKWSRPCSCSATRCTARGPEEMRPVGETEFVAGIAAMSDSGGYGQDAGRRGHRGIRRPDAGRAGRAGAGGADPRRRRTVPRRAAFRQLGRRPHHRQRRAGSRTSIAAPISAPAWRGFPRLGCRWMRGCSLPNWPT